MNKKCILAVVIVCLVLGGLLLFLFLTKGEQKTASYVFPENSMHAYLEKVIADPSEFHPQDLSQYKIGEFEDVFAEFEKLRDTHPEIMEEFLTQTTFTISSDHRISLEGLIHKQFNEGTPFSSEDLQKYSIDSVNQLNMVLREIYMRDQTRFSELVAAYYASGASADQHYFTKTADPKDLYGILSQQQDFYNWPGWKHDLTADEKIMLYEGKRRLERLSTFNKENPIPNISEEIQALEEYLARYKQTELPRFYIGGIYLYLAQADLYAINGDFDRAIAIAHDAVAIADGFTQRREYDPVYDAPGVLPVEGMEWYFYWMRGWKREQEGNTADALKDYKSAEALMHHNLLANPFGLLDIFALWYDIKEQIRKMEG